MLVNGNWAANWHPIQSKDESGRFVRQQSTIRNWVTSDGSAGPTGRGGFEAEAGRYRLYVALICPWASRTLVARKLKKLDELVAVTVVNPVLGEQGWIFGGFPRAEPDPLHSATYLHELYTRADRRYSGRATVPVLWDEKADTMVSNESADILRMFDSAFVEVAAKSPALYPADLAGEIDALNEAIYSGLNNGVYKAGFASTQLAYEEAVAEVFTTLDALESRLTGDFLLGDRFTEADIRLFVTLIRFDLAYVGLFKTNLKRIADYPRLSAYLARVLRLPGVAETVDINHIKAGYYSIKALNPSGIVPVGPAHVTEMLARV